MCGIAGFWQAGGIRVDDAQSAVRRMAGTLQHRGPDDDGVFVSPESGVALSFRRLAIIELSPRGHQPMASPKGQYHLVFNGEIYNHRELRRDLEAQGITFVGRSDTEALTASFQVWVIEETLRRAVGMFAIAAWDATRQRLTMARDRIGIKPLHVYCEAGYVSFGSELKTVAAGPKSQRRLKDDAAREFAAMLHVPGPRSIWRDVMKMPPGTLLELSDPTQPPPAPRAYWSIVSVAQSGRPGGHVLREEDIPATIENVLSLAVSSHLESDVPLRAFLSGGIDSTTVVALMREHFNRPIKTFTIRFDDPVHDKGVHAEAVASRLGTDHTTISIVGSDALDLIPQLVEVYDELFADASQLPRILVSAAARRHMTVGLTGDGGDELFAGYNRYLYGKHMLERLSRLPKLIRQGFCAMINVGPFGFIDRAFQQLQRLPGSVQERRVEEKIRKLGALPMLSRSIDRYQRLVSTGLVPIGEQALPVSGAIAQAFEQVMPDATRLDRMLLADQLSYLPDNKMTKVDRASMSVGLEARAPLLDHRVVKLSWQLPERWLVRNGVGQVALRHIANKYVPQKLLDRPKTGFSVPLAAWLRGPLRP